MTTEDAAMIAELTTLEAAATPLPWRAMPREFMEPEDVVVFRGCGQDVIADGRHSVLVVSGTNQELSAASRNHLPRLLALARRSVEQDGLIEAMKVGASIRIADLEAENARLRAMIGLPLESTPQCGGQP